MLDKHSSFIDSLNSAGIAFYGLILLGIFSLIKWIGGLAAKFTFKKAKEEGVKMLAKEVAKDDDIKKLAKEVAEEVMQHYVPLVRAEATQLFTKHYEENKKEIEAVKAQLTEYRASHHDTIKTLHGVLNATMDTLNDYRDLLMPRKRKSLKKRKTNGKYYDNETEFSYEQNH